MATNTPNKETFIKLVSALGGAANPHCHNPNPDPSPSELNVSRLQLHVKDYFRAKFQVSPI